MKQYFEWKPVSEAPEKPSNGDVTPVLTDLGNAYFTERGTFIDDNEEEIAPKWWLRPLSLAVPESVSELKFSIKRSGEHWVVEDKETLSMKEATNEEVLLWLLLASRDEEVKELKMQAGLDAIHAEGLQARLDACESALEKRDEEVKRLREAAEQLLRFMDPNGKPYDGFAFRDAAVQLRALLTTNTTPTNE